MRTFTRPPKGSRPPSPDKSSESIQRLSGPHRRADSIPGLQKAIGNAQVGRLLQLKGNASPLANGDARSLRELAQDRSPDPGRELQDEREAERLAVQIQQAARTGPPASAVENIAENRSGLDFSEVRIHADAKSARSAALLGARAFTVGRDIMFGTGQFRPGTREGTALLAHELAHVLQQSRSCQARVQMARLRDWQSDRTAAVSDADIRTTDEYLAYMNPALVWQTRDLVTDAEAVQACRYILAALRNGVAFSWSSDARTFMNRARAYLQQIQALVTDQETWLAGEATAAGRTTGEHIHAVAQAGGYGGGPTPWWSGLSGPDRASWMTNANTVIAGVISSVRGTALEAMVAARGIVASPRECESHRAFAYYSSTDNRLHVGREWNRIADRAQGGDPLNVHDNIAHELGGHFEYRQYGTGMADAIMQGVLARLPAAQRAQATAGPKSVYSAYAYPETEIFAELREHDLRTASSGGDVPSTDIPLQLQAIKDRFAPNVAEAIVIELRRRVQEASNISAAAKTLFDNSVRGIFPGLIPP